MMLPLLLLYILSGIGLLVNGFLHGHKRPEEQCYYNLPVDCVKTVIELLFIWWLLGWRVW